MGIDIRYDPEVDALFASFVEDQRGIDVRTEVLDESRLIHYGRDGQVTGVELLWISHGVDFDGLPRGEEIRAALRKIGAAVTAA